MGPKIRLWKSRVFGKIPSQTLFIFYFYIIISLLPADFWKLGSREQTGIKKKGVELGSIWGVCDPSEFLYKYNVKMLVTSSSVEIEVKKHVFEKSIFSIKINMGHISSTGVVIDYDYDPIYRFNLYCVYPFCVLNISYSFVYLSMFVFPVYTGS